MGRVKPTQTIPVGVILTISASSEMSDSCVLTDEETMIKKGLIPM